MVQNTALACASLSILNGMFFGYALIGLATAAGTLWRCYYGLASDTAESEWGISVLFSIINIGGVPYGFIAGSVMNGFGRRGAVGMGATASFVGTALSAIAPTFNIACVARIITGVGIGAISSSIPVYIQEMAPEGSVGTFQAIGGPCIPLTIFLGNLLAFSILGPHRDLKPADYCPSFTRSEILLKNVELMAPASLIALAILGVVVTLMPESESWKRQSEVAPEAPRAKPTWAQEDEEGARLVQAEEEGTAKVAIPSGWRGLRYVPRCIVTGLLMGVAMQGTGINAVFFYAPKFMHLGGVDRPMLGAVLIMAWNLLTALLALLLVDRVGRRKLLLPGLGLMAVSLLLMDPVYSRIEAGTLGSFWSFFLLFGFIAGFEFGPGTLFAVVVNEMIPEPLLATLSPLLGMSMGMLGILVTFIFPALEFHLHGRVFYIFGAVAAATWLFFYCCLPETKGRTREEITAAMTHGSWVTFGRL